MFYTPTFFNIKISRISAIVLSWISFFFFLLIAEKFEKTDNTLSVFGEIFLLLIFFLITLYWFIKTKFATLYLKDLLLQSIAVGGLIGQIYFIWLNGYDLYIFMFFYLIYSFLLITSATLAKFFIFRIILSDDGEKTTD